MTARLYPEGHLNAVSPNIECGADGKSSPFAHCERCGKHHPALWWHKDQGQCTARVGGLYCPHTAINYGSVRRPKWGLYCSRHSVERDGENP